MGGRLTIFDQHSTPERSLTSSILLFFDALLQWRVLHVKMANSQRSNAPGYVRRPGEAKIIPLIRCVSPASAALEYSCVYYSGMVAPCCARSSRLWSELWSHQLIGGLIHSLDTETPYHSSRTQGNASLHESTTEPSAEEILRQRYARGEIDATTFEQMRERLGASAEKHPMSAA